MAPFRLDRERVPPGEIEDGRLDVPVGDAPFEQRADVGGREIARRRCDSRPGRDRRPRLEGAPRQPANAQSLPPNGRIPREFLSTRSCLEAGAPASFL